MPDHLWIALWGHTSSFKDLTMCFLNAWSFTKSVRGESVGGFLRKSVALLKMMRWSILI